MQTTDTTHKTSLIAGFALVISLTACVAPPPRGANIVGDATLPPATPAIQPTPEPTEPPVETNATGLWDLDMFIRYDLRADGTISTSATYAGADARTGEWRALPDGRIYMNVERMGEMTAMLRGNVLIVGNEPNSTVTMIMRRLDEQGNILPANIATSTVPLPLFDPAKVTSVKINETWWGLSPYAPIVSQITLTLASDSALGEAFYSKGNDEPVSATVPLTVPMLAMTNVLAQWAQTPVEAGPYRPFINHTDDYPQVRIELTLPEGSVVFETRSQGQDNLPWQVIVNGKEYVTFSDLPSSAIKLLDPYLAREVQQKL